MKLKDLAKEPTLVKVVLDDEEIVKEYGEPVEFYTWDRQPMNTYLSMASIDSENMSAVFDAIKELVLDEDGNQILDDKNGLPPLVLLKVLNTVVEQLGN